MRTPCRPDESQARERARPRRVPHPEWRNAAPATPLCAGAGAAYALGRNSTFRRGNVGRNAMKWLRDTMRGGALGLGALALAGMAPAHALDYPTRPVHILVGYPAGGSTDILARLM